MLFFIESDIRCYEFLTFICPCMAIIVGILTSMISLGISSTGALLSDSTTNIYSLTSYIFGIASSSLTAISYLIYVAVLLSQSYLMYSALVKNEEQSAEISRLHIILNSRQQPIIPQRANNQLPTHSENENQELLASRDRLPNYRAITATSPINQ